MKNLIKLTLLNIALANSLYAQCIGDDYEQEDILSESIIENVTIAGAKSILKSNELIQLTQDVVTKSGYDDSSLFYYICTDIGLLQKVENSNGYKSIEYTAPNVSSTTDAKIDFRIGDGYGHSSYKSLNVQIEKVNVDFDLSVASSHVIFTNQAITLSATTSNIENDNEATYSWDFGDGTTGSGKSLQHTYNTVGTYYAKVTVSYRGTTKTATTQVRVKDERVIEETVHIMLEKSKALETENVTGWVWFDNISDINRDIDISHSGKNVGISSFVQIKAGEQIGSFTIREGHDGTNDVVEENEYVNISASTSKSNIATTKLYVIDIDDYREKYGAKNGLNISHLTWREKYSDSNTNILETDKVYRMKVGISNDKDFRQQVTLTAEILDSYRISLGSKTCTVSLDKHSSGDGYAECEFSRWTDLSDSIPSAQYNLKITATSSDCIECKDVEYFSVNIENKKVNDISTSIFSRENYSLDIEDIDTKVVASFGTRAYEEKPITPHLTKVYMENEDGNKKVILNQYLNLNVSDWQQFVVYLPSDTVEGVYKLWIEAETMNRETNILNNKSKIITITVTDKNRVITPQLKIVSDKTLLKGTNYTTQLELIEGTEPITFEVISTPSTNISVNTTGTVSLNTPSVGEYKITAKATNKAGVHEQSWTIFVELKDTDSDGIPDDEDLDDDNDGISDLEEIANGLNPLDPSDAEADNDGDGYTNAEEIAQGSDINDANSKPTPATETRTLIIRKGFGLYGMNSSMSLAQLIEKIGVDNLRSIDSSGKTYQLNYVNDGLDFLNDFDKLELFKAVWINVIENVTITYEETNYIDNQEITLNGGIWYLLNPPKAMSLESIKNQVGETNIDTIQGLVTTYQQKYVDEDTSFLNDFIGFEEPKGYWIKLKNDAVLRFDFSE